MGAQRYDDPELSIYEAAGARRCSWGNLNEKQGRRRMKREGKM